MNRATALSIAFGCLAALALTSARSGAQAPAKEVALAALTVECDGRGTSFHLAGRDSGLQLLVTGRTADGAPRDVTRQASYEVTPAGIVRVDTSGYVTAVKEGKATVRIKASAVETTASVRVTDIEEDLPVHFANDVVPILTRHGCNAGGCHGKSGGQNGFALSLLGFEPDEDYEYIVKENRGRRIFAAAPEHSLLLRKASGAVAHGGGARLPADSAAYRVLRRWVEQGAPPSDPLAAEVSFIRLLPRERVLGKGGAQQLAVVAHYTDGSTADVTRLTQFESNNAEVAAVSDSGLVSAGELPGTAAVMARFAGCVDVFRVTVPLGVPVADLPPAKNFIDELVFKELKRLGLPPSKVCDDSTFLRRVTLDVAGRLPTLDETREFLAEKVPDRREKLIDRLLATPDYADHFASKWNAVLRNKRQGLKDDVKPHAVFHAWIRDSLHSNKPLDVFVRELLTAKGEEIDSPPVTWYREVKDAPTWVEDTAQLFLGTRLGCAKCHHHPQEKWSQQDYYGLAAFFGRVTYKSHPDRFDPKKKDKGAKTAIKPLVDMYHNPGEASVVHPRSGARVLPALLDGVPLKLPPDVDPRTKLAEWVTAKDNPLFARAAVNRHWKHFFGRGLVDPEDDLRVTNPPSNPELLDALAKHFVDTHYDLKKLIKTICASSAYQLSAVPNEHNKGDRQNFSRFVPRRLPAEVLHDALDQVTLAKTQFPGLPEGTRAVQLPDNAFESYFLTLFGRPAGASACECERSGDVTLPQVLHLMNSWEVLAKVSGPPEKGKLAAKRQPKAKQAGPAPKVTPGERVLKLAADKRPHRDRLRELYLIALSRDPSAEEMQVMLRYVERPGQSVRAAYEDVLWAVINTEEFLFNH